MQTLDLAMG